jgi:succinate dehydrogenase / fumarate reductase, cytochrome b subunit
MTETSGLPPRPLSPHLSIWRWHVTMFTSIAHRATGVGLYVAALIAAGWAVSLASGPEVYGAYMALLGSVLGKLVLFAITVALFYHLANGTRHLVWDFGYGFQIKTADFSGVVVIAFAVAASIGLWIVAAMRGLL